MVKTIEMISLDKKGGPGGASRGQNMAGQGENMVKQRAGKPEKGRRRSGDHNKQGPRQRARWERGGLECMAGQSKSRGHVMG